MITLRVDLCKKKLIIGINSPNEGIRRCQMSTQSAILKLDTLFILTTKNLGQGVEVDKKLKFKSVKSMQVEFIMNNVDMITLTHGCLSSVALTLLTTD